MECVEWLSKRRNSVIQVGSLEQPYSSNLLKYFGVNVLGEFKTEQAFGLIGLQVPSTFENKVKGKVLMECHRSSTFQPQRDMDNLINFLENNLGICQVDIFKRGELKSENCVKIKPMYVHETEKVRFMKNTKDIVSKCKELMKIYDGFCQNGNRVEIVNIAPSVEQKDG